jgi:membrane-associated protease RseP (regulator of RpoE activity)
MKIEEVIFAPAEDDEPLPPTLQAQDSIIAARFAGQLRFDSESAYEQLDRAFTEINHTPVFRLEDGQHVALAMRGRIRPQQRPWWPNLALFIATVLSVLFVGSQLAISEIAQENIFLAQRIANDFPANLLYGWPFATSLLLILGSHELGHYFAARRHGLAVTLPYFIPLPFFSLLGTMGAFIQLQQPLRNRKALLDVGAAGPLTGLIFAVPILFIGLAGARTGPVSPGGIYEGDSLLYAFAKIVTYGEFLPNGSIDVLINSNQLAWAGWTGLLVTALNLIPIGQLDGGHILYSLLGERARLLYYPLIGVMIVLTFMAQVWLFWVVLLLLFGRAYATPLDMITPLDRPRRVLAVFSLVVFLLIFVPTPLTSSNSGPPVVLPPGERVETLPDSIAIALDR